MAVAISTGGAPRTAADIGKHANLGPKARRLLRDGAMPNAYLAALVEQGLHADGIRFMAQAMLPRPSIWWACLCVRHTAGEPVPAKEQAPLHAALGWVLEPTDANRRAARQAGRAAGRGSAAGALAQAAFWLG